MGRRAQALMRSKAWQSAQAVRRRAGFARRTLAGRGMVETVTWSFRSSELAAGFGGGNPALKLANPISAELDEMRPSILPNQMDLV